MGRSSPELATPRGCGLPEEAVAQLEAAGFDVAGALAIDDYDARVPPPWRSEVAAPGARRAIVLGCEVAECYAAIGQLALAEGEVKTARRMLKKAQKIDLENPRTQQLHRQLRAARGRES